MTDDLAAPHDRDAVGDLKHLFQLVADEDDRLARLDQVAQHDEELGRLLRREYTRRLVEDEDARAAIQHLHDLGPLLQAHRQVTGASVGVQRQAVALRELGDLAAGS